MQYFHPIFMYYCMSALDTTTSFYFGTSDACSGGVSITEVAECKKACNDLQVESGTPELIEGGLCYKNSQNKCRQRPVSCSSCNIALICKKGKFLL